MALVNFENVAEAAESLQVAGQRPSVRAVTAKLGGGSPNAVLKFLAEWKAGRPVVRVADTDLDPRITSAIAEQMQRVASEAASAAEERAAGIEDDLQALAEAQQAAEQQIDALTGERDAFSAQVVQLTDALHKNNEEAERQQKQAAEALDKLGTDLATERKAVELARIELGKFELRLEALPRIEAEADRLRGELDRERTAKIAAEQSAAVAVARLEAMTDRATKAEAASEKAEKKVAQALLDLSELQSQVQAKQTALDAAEQAAAVAVARLDGMTDRAKKADTAATKAEQQAAQAAQELTSARVQLQAQQTALDAAARECDDLRRQTQGARAEAKKSGEEAAELRGQLSAKTPTTTAGKKPAKPAKPE